MKNILPPGDQINKILSLVPGYAVLQDRQVRFIGANNRAVTDLGFDCMEQMQGLYPGEIRCSAAELHDQVVASVNYVITRDCSVTLLYSAYLTNDQWGLFLGQQQPLRDASGAITGVSTHTFEVTHTPLARQALHFFLEQKSKGRTRVRQGIYQYLDSRQEWDLPMRQGECFFWLLQRKSAKEISVLLGLSKRTVEYYIDLIKQKFHVKTLPALLEAAEANGISNYIPQHWCGLISASC